MFILHMYEVCSKLYRNEFIKTKQLMLERNLFFTISPHSSRRFECTFRRLLPPHEGLREVLFGDGLQQLAPLLS